MGRNPGAKVVNSGGLGGTFGSRLRHARDAAGLTQEELAERSGLTPNAISALERGEHKHPYPATVRALADALGMSVDERAVLVASVPKRNRGKQTIANEPDALSAHLPVALSSLIGREQEEEIISSLMQRKSVRLITLTGPGGVGKTRLAVHVANRLTEHFADGVAFVALAAVRDHTLVASTIAQSLSVTEPGIRSQFDRLREALQDRQVLLVLDNFEHLLPAAPLVTALLTRCPQLSVLATSRAPLRLTGEHEVPVSPLALPDPDCLPQLDIDEVAEIAAIRLFVERARSVDSAFTLTVDNAAAVAAVCQRLDGLPLAIELAAARSRLFSPSALLPRLAQRLPLLTGGRRDAPERHHTMRDAIAWSYDILSATEQTLFRRLAVFVGGFTLEGAAAVADAEGVESTEIRASSTSQLFTAAIDRVSALIENSLVRQMEQITGHEPRYTMLETVREFAYEQLLASGEADRVGDWHTTWCLDLAERAAPHWFTSEQAAWGDVLEADHDNIRSALTRSSELGGTATGLRLAGRLWPFWFVRGHHTEGRTWLEQALTWDNGVPTIDRVRVLTGASCLARCQGEDPRSTSWGEEALQIVEMLGARTGIDAAHVLIGLGLDAAVVHDFERATTINNEVVSILRGLRDIEPSAAQIESSILNNLADIAFNEGDDKRAIRLAKEALAQQRQFGFTWAAMDALFILALVAYRMGDVAQAAAFCQESLEAWDRRDPQQIPLILDLIAFLANASGQTTAAARLIGAAKHLYVRLGLPRSAEGELAITAIRDGLGHAQFEAAHADGWRLPIELATAEAIALAEALSFDRDASE